MNPPFQSPGVLAPEDLHRVKSSKSCNFMSSFPSVIHCSVHTELSGVLGSLRGREGYCGDAIQRVADQNVSAIHSDLIRRVGRMKSL